MSGPPKVRSMNVADSETRPVLGPTGNKTRSVTARKPAAKPLRKVERPDIVSPCARDGITEESESPPPVVVASPPPPPPSPRASSILRRHEQLLQSNLNLNASCSSDASSDSMYSRASTGRVSQTSLRSRKKQREPKPVKGVPESVPVSTVVLQDKKRCAWVTPNTDPCYITFHDEEWGVPVHDDKKLFELLVLSGALAELTWPTILSKRHIFREVFADFDPAAVAKLNEKKIVAPGSIASSLLSEPKLRAIIENARQIVKIVEEFGSFDKYIWSFVNQKPIVSRFRYQRQVLVKTPKADVISKDLVRRGFRSVGPTVAYSFMQAAGLTNDHLLSCYRFSECVEVAEGAGEDGNNTNSKASKVEEKTNEEMGCLGLANGLSELSIAQRQEENVN